MYLSARMHASWTTSSASSGLRVSQRARLCAASSCGKTNSSKRLTSDKRMLLALLSIPRSGRFIPAVNRGRRLILCAGGHVIPRMPSLYSRHLDFDAAGIYAYVGRYCIAHPLLFSREELSMKHPIDRREFLKLAGLGSVVFASSLGAARAAGTMAAAKGGPSDDFYFVQLSDSHWGFEGQTYHDVNVT